jgi:hypothetical protein
MASIVMWFFPIQLIVVPDAIMAEAAQDLEHVAAEVVGLETNVNQVKCVAWASVAQLLEEASFQSFCHCISEQVPFITDSVDSIRAAYT